MSKEDKDQILANYKHQRDALVQQRQFSSDMVEEFARRITSFEVDSDFFYSGVVDEFSKVCRQFLKFYELRERVSSDVLAISSEIDIIQDMK